MNNNLFNDEKLLKIFSSVRCLSKEQLPRYLDGSMTPLERHLIEQHLVSCDLCHEALQALQDDKVREQYNAITGGIVQFVQENTRVNPVVEKRLADKVARKGRLQDTLLSSFWIIVLGGLITGGYYLVQYRLENPPAAIHKLSSAAVPPNQQMAGAVGEIENIQRRQTTNQPIVENAVLRTTTGPDSMTLHHPAQENTGNLKTGALPAVIKKVDSSKMVIKKDLLQVKSPKDSSNNKLHDTKVIPQAEKSLVTALNKPAEKVNSNPDNDNSIAKKDKDVAPPKKQENETSSVMPSNDEYLYRAALLYQQQGAYDEAISQFKKLSNSRGKYNELAKYQLAQCYKQNGQHGKARRLLKEIARGDGSMKTAAQSALNDMN